MRVSPDASGESATAVFDKEWVFEGAGKYNAGKVQTQLQLRKFGGDWRITGERDLKVYYVDKSSLNSFSLKLKVANNAFFQV